VSCCRRPGALARPRTGDAAPADPLGIHNPQWHRCPLGWIVGCTGLELRTEELARVGRLLRNRGGWGSRLLVDAAWVDRMHASWVETGREAPFERYGFAVWDGPGRCWRLDGRYRQYVIIDEAQGSVITTAHEESSDHLDAELAYAAMMPTFGSQGESPTMAVVPRRYGGNH
jgi:hypothetical protein